MQAHQISMENKYNANQLQQQYQRKVESYHTSCGLLVVVLILVQTCFITNHFECR